MAKKADNRYKTDEQKFIGILGSVKYRKKCYINEMAKALYVRYGVEDLKVWVKDSNMLDTLAALDTDIAIMLKYLYKNHRFTADYSGLFMGMDLKDPKVRQYCYNLAVRELVLSVLQDGIDLEDVDTGAEENTAESEVA